MGFMMLYFPLPCAAKPLGNRLSIQVKITLEKEKRSANRTLDEWKANDYPNRETLEGHYGPCNVVLVDDLNA